MSAADVTVPPRARRGLLAALGAIGAAFFASLCCVGPLLFVTLGVGAGLAGTFEPLRPFFTLLAVSLISLGFYVVYGRRGTTGRSDDGPLDCAPDGACAVPRDRSRDKILLWTAAVVVVVFLTFPRWSVLLL